MSDRNFVQGQTVAFGGNLFTVALVLNLIAPIDPGDRPGTWLALREPTWAKGMVWIVPAAIVDPPLRAVA